MVGSGHWSVRSLRQLGRRLHHDLDRPFLHVEGRSRLILIALALESREKHALAVHRLNRRVVEQRDDRGPARIVARAVELHFGSCLNGKHSDVPYRAGIRLDFPIRPARAAHTQSFDFTVHANSIVLCRKWSKYIISTSYRKVNYH